MQGGRPPSSRRRWWRWSQSCPSARRRPTRPPHRRPARRVPASRCRPASARRSSPTISVAPAISPSLRTGPSTSIPWAARHRPPVSWWRSGIPKGRGGPMSSSASARVRGRRDGHRLLQGRDLCRDERSHPALPPAGRRHPAERGAAGGRLRPAARRGSSHASLRDRRPGRSVRRCRLGDQFLPAPKSRAELARRQALHRAANPGRHLALRRQQDGAAFLDGGALRQGAAQRRRPELRFGGPALRHPARPRPALRELAEPLQARAGSEPAGRGARDPEARRRLWLAGMLFRRLSEEARPGARIWRRRRQIGEHLRGEAGAPSPPSPPIGPRTTC